MIPAISISTIAGLPVRHATHCAPTPSKPISAILSISDSAIALSCGLGACDATTRARPWFQRWRPGERPWPRLRSRTMPVQGIGGLFFRARDPEGLADWYRRHLGIGAGCAAEGTGTPDDWLDRKSTRLNSSH